MTAIALALTAVIAAGTDVPWFVALFVFLFWGPVSTAICGSIASRNPLLRDADAAAAAQSSRPETDSSDESFVWVPATATLVIVSLAVALVGSKLTGAGFRTAVGYSFLATAFSFGVNAIVIEVEENAPGGFLRPDTWKKNR